MNTIIQFINRKNELQFLENQIKKEAAMIVIYGRRRVGKSELLKQFIKEKKAIYLLSTQEVEKEIATDFSKELGRYFGDQSLKINPFVNLTQILEYINVKDLRDMIIIIDEFPYLVDANKAIPSILQKFWDQSLKSKGLKLILCGSSIGAMETEVLGRKSPLYGRRTGQWKVDPLGFREFIKFFPDCPFEKVIEFYSITGGIPLYILELDVDKSTLENSQSSLASRGSILYQEAEIILKEELREPKTYFSILREINNGKNALNEIANALGAERTSLIRYLDTLINLDLIEIIKPITSQEKSRKTIYAIKDNYFKFWFKFVYPFKKELDSFILDDFNLNFSKNFNTYLGRQFEQICIETIKIDNPLKTQKIGTWWGAYRDNGERKNAEIDIVSINNETKSILFGECKWKENVDPNSLLKELKEKAVQVRWNNENRKETFVLFAKSFSKKTNTNGVLLYDLKTLETIFKDVNSG